MTETGGGAHSARESSCRDPAPNHRLLRIAALLRFRMNLKGHGGAARADSPLWKQSQALLNTKGRRGK